MQCPNDKHNFIQADVYTGGTLYRCDKCGLEVQILLIFPEVRRTDLALMPQCPARQSL